MNIMVSRSQLLSIVSPKYLHEKLRPAKEVAFLLRRPNMFVTLSFADNQHPVLQRLLGVPGDASFSERQRVVAQAPGLCTAVFTKLKDFFVQNLLFHLFGVDYAIDRDEFQARFSVHAHMVMSSKFLDYSESVAAVVKGRAARHLLFLLNAGSTNQAFKTWELCEEGFGDTIANILVEIGLGSATNEELVNQIILARHYSDDYLVKDVNADPPPDFDIVLVS